MIKITDERSLKIIPLGGLGEIGKNMCAVEYGDDIIVIDSGLTFPDDEMPGVDVVIPDISYLEKNRDRLRGIVITHGHEDHYGGVPYFLKKIQTKVYCTRLTAGLLENKLKEFGISPSCIRYVKAGDTIVLGAFKCEFIRVAHSIPDSCAIAVYNPVGTILFTGDFKMDFTPIDNEPTDIWRLAEIGKDGVLALYADSTNVEHEGVTMSERTVGETFRKVFAQASDRIIVATFASNLHRVQQIIWAAEANGRKVCLSGRSMVNNIQVAKELGYISIKEKTLIDISELNKYEDKEITLLITGTQGEPMSALSRMAYDEHNKIKLTDKDTVILSASMIPGNEKSIGDMINKLTEHGCTLVYSSLAEVHVSGHACQEELKLMHALTKPKFFIPAHGETRMQITHKKLAESMGLDSEHIFLAENGSVIEFKKTKKGITGEISGKVQAGNVLVDGLGVGDVGNVVLNDRKRLAENGMIAVVVTVDHDTNKLLAGPEIISRGFVYMKDSVDLFDEIKNIVVKVFDEAEKKKLADWNYLKGKIREEIKGYIYTEFKRNPMILSIIMDVNGEEK